MRNLGISYKRLKEIITEEIVKVTDNGDEISIRDGRRFLKHVTATDKRHLRPVNYDVWVCRDPKTNEIVVEWKQVGKPVSFTCTEYLRPVDTERRLYSSMANWDELDWALGCLGAKKVKETNQKVDDFGDITTFTTSYYDLSSLFS